MYVAPLLVALCLVVGTRASTPAHSNAYVDRVLAQTFPATAGAVQGELSGTRFQVGSGGLITGLLTNPLAVTLKKGVVTGLQPPYGLRRTGDCSPPTLVNGNITIGCYVTLDALKVRFEGSYSSGTILASVASFLVDGSLSNSKAYLEVTARPGNMPALKTWKVLPTNVVLTFSRRPDLSPERFQEFYNGISAHIQRVFNAWLYGPLVQALAYSVRVNPLTV
uniref:Putative secreted protein n=1 Tax=Ornithodoros turicata TaxID=34597 RepID=A0A2R5L4U9_9ACAR